MISFTRLGKRGRLGNQMFQYAALKAVGLARGFEVRIPRYPGLEIIDVFDIPEAALSAHDAGRLVNAYEEPRFSFSDAVFEIPDDCDLNGYFQSERYFERSETSIRESLAFRRDVVSSADAASKRLLGRGWFKATPVSIHVRRGDYLSLPNHYPECDADYYDRALSVLEERFGRLQVAVFSDDIAWCRTMFRGRRYRFAEGNDLGTDMCLMSRCEHHVIANSSFSWWGAWLNPSPEKVVLAPKAWFGPEAPQDDHDLIPEAWIRI